ncbi:hypothetical protein [Archangium violaceum]|uniref:DAC domain-containing protein n=1 Tax=Archangium violaceum Cb vi76 TaxID=1406225 RepID=A0A084SXH7_9BACT|nr:hypothetical protein [Archangium violaceum]KFA93162.1 hypothetical protein Q664_10740 [Archangium violaceum Cb vi76]
MSTLAPGESPVLSFRHMLSDAVCSFLHETGLSPEDVGDPLGELIVTLSRYREEGEPLFPVAFLGDDLEGMLRVLGGREPVAIGRGPRTRETIQRALKQCAPLGQGRWWSLYMLLVPEGFAYGVFRTEPFPLVETPLERMRRAGDRSLRMVGVLQLAENVIELRAMGGLYRHVFLSGARVESTLPTVAMDELALGLTADVPEPARGYTRDFYRRVLFEAMQASHGTLVAVLPRRSEGSPLFVDGVLLEEPIDMVARVMRYHETREVEAASAVSSAAQLLRGMMATDGITVLRSDGFILGYNVFIRHPESLIREPARVGGARRRTYEVLCAWVGRELTTAFFRSQDGAIACCRD